MISISTPPHNNNNNTNNNNNATNNSNPSSNSSTNGTNGSNNNNNPSYYDTHVFPTTINNNNQDTILSYDSITTISQAQNTLYAPSIGNTIGRFHDMLIEFRLHVNYSYVISFIYIIERTYEFKLNVGQLTFIFSVIMNMKGFQKLFHYDIKKLDSILNIFIDFLKDLVRSPL